MIPKQVQRQAEEVDRLEQELAARRKVQTEPAVDDPAKPKPEAQTEGDQGDGAPPAPPVEKKDDEETWKQRFLTLRGKYDAEMGPLFQQNRELQQKLQDLTARIDTLSQKPKEPERSPATPLVTPQDVESFGGDLVDLIKRQAQETFRERENELVSKIKELEAKNAQLSESVTSVEQRQGQTQQQAFIRRLGELVPDWEKLNTDVRFLGWLRGSDPLSGMERQVLLDAAASGYQVERAAALFNAFKKEAGIVAPTPTPTPTPQPTPQRTQPNPEVSAQIAPGKSRAASPAPAADPKTRIWSMREIEQFYRDATQGVYRGRSEEQARIEAEIDLAVAEGRVR